MGLIRTAFPSMMRLRMMKGIVGSLRMLSFHAVGVNGDKYLVSIFPRESLESVRVGEAVRRSSQESLKTRSGGMKSITSRITFAGEHADRLDMVTIHKQTIKESDSCQDWALGGEIKLQFRVVTRKGDVVGDMLWSIHVKQQGRGGLVGPSYSSEVSSGSRHWQ
jgi:hypothetical protein